MFRATKKCVLEDLGVKLVAEELVRKKRQKIFKIIFKNNQTSIIYINIIYIISNNIIVLFN